MERSISDALREYAQTHDAAIRLFWWNYVIFIGIALFLASGVYLQVPGLWGKFAALFFSALAFLPYRIITGRRSQKDACIAMANVIAGFAHGSANLDAAEKKLRMKYITEVLDYLKQELRGRRKGSFHESENLPGQHR
jgi:hypothetical protein